MPEESSVEKGFGQGCGLVFGVIFAIAMLIFVCCGCPGLLVHVQQDGQSQQRRK
jgi:hypothetical protein